MQLDTAALSALLASVSVLHDTRLLISLIVQRLGCGSVRFKQKDL